MTLFAGMQLLLQVRSEVLARGEANAEPWLRHAQVLLPHVGCMACVHELSQKLEKIPGLLELRASARTPVKLVLIYDGNQIKLADLLAVMRQRDQDPKVLFDVDENKFSLADLGKRQTEITIDPLNQLLLPEQTENESPN